MINDAILWGAVCGKAARTDLRGVYAVMYISTHSKTEVGLAAKPSS